MAKSDTSRLGFRKFGKVSVDFLPCHRTTLLAHASSVMVGGAGPTGCGYTSLVAPRVGRGNREQ
jgi:hypothetical protein